MRVLSIIGGATGGPVQLARDPGKARNIHVTVANSTAVTHGAFFGRSRRELEQMPPQGQSGFAVIAVANTVATSTLGGVAYTSLILQGWLGELWAVADIDATLQVEVLDSGAIEK